MGVVRKAAVISPAGTNTVVPQLPRPLPMPENELRGRDVRGEFEHRVPFRGGPCHRRLLRAALRPDPQPLILRGRL